MGHGREKLFLRGVDRPAKPMPLAPGNPVHIMRQELLCESPMRRKGKLIVKESFQCPCKLGHADPVPSMPKSEWLSCPGASSVRGRGSSFVDFLGRVVRERGIVTGPGQI
jgi:hypothetical protein